MITAGGALHICPTRHSHGRRCVTYMSHPSLTRQVVRYIYISLTCVEKPVKEGYLKSSRCFLALSRASLFVVVASS